MAQLGVVTIHFEYPKVTDTELRRLAVSFFEISENAVREFIPLDVAVVVDLEEASLKVRTKIVAGAIAVGTFLSNYGSVRQGALDLAHDVKMAGDFIIEKIEHQVGVPRSDVIATRRSATLSRRIRHIFDEVESGRINSDEAMRQLIGVLDPDSEGPLPPELIDGLKREIEAARQHDQQTVTALSEKPKSQSPRREPPPIPREKALRPRRLRITRKRGEIRIDEVT